MPAPSARSIVWPILALVLASVGLATAVIFVVTFSGPPPRDPPRGLQSIARAMTTGEQPIQPGPKLTVRTTAAEPRIGGDHGFPLRDNPVIRAQLARLLHADAKDVRAWTSLQPPGIPDAFVGRFLFAWRTSAGWRVVENARPPWFLRWHWTTLAAMLLTLLALAPLAWALARTLSRPLRQLADAAEQARAGAARPAFPTGGPAEVRALTGAVSAMHDRLVEHAESRTRMLAAIAHDLGTPLARLSFWVEHLPERARDRAGADIDEMRAMIGDVLGFARDEAGERDATLVELGSLLDSLAQDMGGDGARVEFIAGPALRVRLDRSRQIEDEVVEALGERDVAVEVGPTVGLSFNQLLSPFDSLTVAADFRWDVAGAHDGFVIAPSVSYFTPVSRAAAVILSVGAEHVDGDYADYYFDVSPGQSLASGLPVFDADSGWKNVGVNALVSYDLGGDLTDGGLSVNVAGGYSRMLEDAKRTPSTSIRGDADQWFGGIGLAYTF